MYPWCEEIRAEKVAPGFKSSPFAPSNHALPASVWILKEDDNKVVQHYLLLLFNLLCQNADQTILTEYNDGLLRNLLFHFWQLLTPNVLLEDPWPMITIPSHPAIIASVLLFISIRYFAKKRFNFFICQVALIRLQFCELFAFKDDNSTLRWCWTKPQIYLLMIRSSLL